MRCLLFGALRTLLAVGRCWSIRPGRKVAGEVCVQLLDLGVLCLGLSAASYIQTAYIRILGPSMRFVVRVVLLFFVETPSCAHTFTREEKPLACALASHRRMLPGLHCDRFGGFAVVASR